MPEFRRGFFATLHSTWGESGFMAPILDEFDALHDLHFHDRALLQQAFVHRSYLNEQDPTTNQLSDNERLEFLGDSVIGFVVSEVLYLRYPTAKEGTLTHLRTLLVRRETLAQLALDMDMGGQLLLGVGEEESGGRLRLATLCACFEALVGSLFLDQGLEKVKRFLMPRIDGILDKMQVDLMPKDPKSRFQEWAQRTSNFTPRYKVAEAFGPDHAKTFITIVSVKNEQLGVGMGPSKQDASQGAAAAALFRVGEPAPEHVPNPDLEQRFGLGSKEEEVDALPAEAMDERPTPIIAGE